MTGPADRRAELVFFDAGGGHRAAAAALKEVLEQQRAPWSVTLVNLGEVLRPLDVVCRLWGVRVEDVYNGLLRKEMTWGAAYSLKVFQRLIAAYHEDEIRLLQKYWSSRHPDVVVSLVPNFNRALSESVRLTWPSVPFVTILTDLADYPPHFWIERESQYFICGTPQAVEQTLAAGHAPERVFLTSGMILRPSFYEPIHLSRTAGRANLGLRTTTPTGLVLFGGEGSRAIQRIAVRLEKSKLDLQLILMVGRNAGLEQTLRQRRWRFPVHVQAFTTEVAHLMSLADFFIGKPGPGSLSEAIAMKLPVVVESNSWTLPQERFNAEWIQSQQLGVVVRSFRNVADAVGRLLAGLDSYRANVAGMRNRAVFEIPQLLHRVVDRSSPP